MVKLSPDGFDRCRWRLHKDVVFIVKSFLRASVSRELIQFPWKEIQKVGAQTEKAF